jgi:hypothetical protein
MKKVIPIGILSFILAFTASGQHRVLDVNGLDFAVAKRFNPDVEGKALIYDSRKPNTKIGFLSVDITVFPGFPIATAGANERGGVYANLDDDPEYELIYPIGAVLYAFNIDGSSAAGWPIALDFPADGAAAYGDIDGDGKGEIVVTTHEVGTFAKGTVYAFEHNGTNTAGFPVTTDGGAVRTPVLADLDGDQALEIIVAMRDWPEGLIYVYKGDGTIYAGWPVRMDYVPGSAVAVGDINGDEIPEIVAESYYSLHVFTPEGFLFPGFPYFPGDDRVFSYSSPVLADIDGDGNREIICGDHSLEDGSGAVHIVNHEGQSREGWPKITGSWIYGPPAVGDIDGDGLLDIAVGDQAISTVPINKIYAWTALSGEPLNGFPILDLFGVNSQIILADFDDDNQIELVFDDNTSEGKYPGYNHDGTAMEGWPLPVAGTTFFVNPLVFDFDLNGTMDLSGAGYQNSFAETNLYLWDLNVEMNKSLAILPILQYNTRHNGVYGDTLMVGLAEQGQGEEGKRSWMYIYPNPAGGIINVEFLMLNSNSTYSVYIFNNSGTEVKIIPLAHGQDQISLNTEDLKPGVYIAILKEDDKYRAFQKFIITR